MYILTVEAFADFDIPYEVYVGALKDKVRADCLKEKLNECVNNKINNWRPIWSPIFFDKEKIEWYTFYQGENMEEKFGCVCNSVDGVWWNICELALYRGSGRH